MHFGPNFTKEQVNEQHDRNIDVNEEVNLNGTPITEWLSTKFLGVIIDNQLSWLPHIDYLHKKLKSSTGIINKYVQKFQMKIKNHYIMLYLEATCHIALLYLDM